MQLLEHNKYITGYFTNADFLWGENINAIERKVGFPLGSLERDGFGIYHMERLPVMEEILPRPYSQMDESSYAHRFGITMEELDRLSERELAQKYLENFNLDYAILKRNIMERLRIIGHRKLVKILTPKSIEWPNEKVVGTGIPQWKLKKGVRIKAVQIKNIPPSWAGVINCV